jgi:hypothetical protein
MYLSEGVVGQADFGKKTTTLKGNPLSTLA